MRGKGIKKAAVVIACIVAAACSRGMPAEFPAPDFTVEDIFTGEAITLSDYADRPVIIYFFASW